MSRLPVVWQHLWLQLNNQSPVKRSGRLLLRFSPQNADQIFLVLDVLLIWAGKS
jgi:hypothetical protein